MHISTAKSIRGLQFYNKTDTAVVVAVVATTWEIDLALVGHYGLKGYLFSDPQAGSVTKLLAKDMFCALTALGLFHKQVISDKDIIEL